MSLVNGRALVNSCRPKPTAPAPWSLISNNEEDIEAMKTAAHDPSLMLVSDWTSFKSWEYLAAMEESKLSILLVFKSRIFLGSR